MASSIQPRWRRLPEERPAQILDAALEVFAEHGLAAARLEDIAKRAHLSKGTIYQYFPNKEALFREVIRQTVVSQIEIGEREFESATDSATARFDRQMRAYWAFIRSPKFAPIFRLVHAELSQHPDLARFYADEVVTRVHRLIAAIIQRGIDEGEFREVDPLVAARMLSAPFVMHGIWCRHRDAFTWMANKTDDQVLEELMHFNLSTICITPPAKPVRRRTKVR
jgi:AcrR family transcriptional regulator